MQPTPAHKRRSLLPLLLLLTELAYIATYLTSMGLNDWTFESLKLNPMAGGSAATMRKLGAVDYDRVVNNHQWWRVLAAPFLCSGKFPTGMEVYVASLCFSAKPMNWLVMCTTWPCWFTAAPLQHCSCAHHISLKCCVSMSNCNAHLPYTCTAHHAGRIDPRASILCTAKATSCACLLCEQHLFF